MHEEILSRFAVPGRFLRSVPFGSGLINETSLAEFEENGAVRKFILQRINTKVFSRPESVMRNVEIVTSHIQDRLRQGGVADPESVTPALVRAVDGKAFLRDADNVYWRMFHFIETGRVYDTVQGPSHAFEVGRALGRFQALTADLSPGRLDDTLPGFHHTPLVLDRFDAALRTAPRERVREAKEEIGYVQRRRSLAPLLTGPMRSGKAPVRVTHNDPKVNNVMVDSRTGAALCMLDLDTAKPGITLFDIGDCIRSAANPQGEDAERLDAVRIDPELAASVLRGYLGEAGRFLARAELDLLTTSVSVITYELGVRFLTDFLGGDVYFRVRYPGHNLHRGRVQFRLLRDIGAAEERMAAEIASLDR